MRELYSVQPLLDLPDFYHWFLLVFCLVNLLVTLLNRELVNEVLNVEGDQDWVNARTKIAAPELILES